MPIWNQNWLTSRAATSSHAGNNCSRGQSFVILTIDGRMSTINLH